MTKSMKILRFFWWRLRGLRMCSVGGSAAKAFKQVSAVPGGVTVKGGWPDVWRANLWIRGAGRVIANLDSFKVDHLALLEKRSRQVPWAECVASGCAVPG